MNGHDGFRSRKFVAAVAVFAAACAFLGFGRLDGDQWITVTTLALGIFTGGNMAEWFARRPGQGGPE